MVGLSLVSCPPALLVTGKGPGAWPLPAAGPWGGGATYPCRDMREAIPDDWGEY